MHSRDYFKKLTGFLFPLGSPGDIFEKNIYNKD